MSGNEYVKPKEGKFANAIFQIQGALTHRILHRGVLSYLAENGIANSRVLEAGCGPGGFTKRLCRLEPSTITAGDVNEELLARGRSRVADDRVEFRSLDLTRPFDLESHSFDWVICISVLMHLPPEISVKTISEFARVVRRGGRVLVAVINTDWAESLYEPKTDEGPYARCVPAGESLIREFYPPAEKYLAAFTDAGMEVERQEICVPADGVEAGPPYDTRVGEPVWTVYVGTLL